MGIGCEKGWRKSQIGVPDGAWSQKENVSRIGEFFRYVVKTLSITSYDDQEENSQGELAAVELLCRGLVRGFRYSNSPRIHQGPSVKKVRHRKGFRHEHGHAAEFASRGAPKNLNPLQ